MEFEDSKTRRSIVTSLPSDYSDVQPKSYDPEFISDISNKMQIPDTIPVMNGDSEFNLRRSAGWGDREEMEIRRHNMNVPERILLGGGGEHIGARPEIRALNLDDSFTNERRFERVSLATPPRTLTIEEQFPAVDQEDDENEEQEMDRNNANTRMMNGSMVVREMQTPVSMSDSFMMTGQETSQLRKQLTQLSRKMNQLEKKQEAQATREKLLYTAAFGYLMLKFMFWFLRGK